MSDSEEHITKSKTRVLSIDVTDKQRKAIQELFVKNEWEWPEVSDSKDEEFDPDNVKPGYIIPQNKEREECPHCLCRPCITDETNRQMYWPANNAVPNRFSNILRRKMYKNFWTMLYNRDVWRDERYRERKAQALGLRNNRQRFVWMHRRDLMPNCVLTQVRQWYPNLPNEPYMGHLWQ